MLAGTYREPGAFQLGLLALQGGGRSGIYGDARHLVMPPEDSLGWGLRTLQNVPVDELLFIGPLLERSLELVEGLGVLGRDVGLVERDGCRIGGDVDYV